MDGLTPKQAFIYGVYERGGKCFYVGSTEKSVAARFNTHIAQVQRLTHTNKYFTEYVTRIGAENCEAVCLETTTTDLRFIREYEWLASFESDGVPLTNIVKSIEQNKRLIESRQRTAVRNKYLLVEIIKKNVDRYSKSRFYETCHPYLRELMAFAGLWKPQFVRPKVMDLFRSEVQYYLVSHPEFSIKVFGMDVFCDAMDYAVQNEYAKDFGIVTAIAIRPHTALQAAH